ncbi:MAG: hypothetical protein R6V07_12830 [Armatimonadota bacterium]
MSYEDLLKDQSIKSYSPTSREITALIEIAHVRLRELRQGEFPPDILYQLCYDVARAAAQALMASEGYRPSGGGGQHKVIFQFLEEADGGRWTREASHFDRARMKRNRALYEEAGLITPEEADRLLEVAGDFLEDVEARIRQGWAQGRAHT